MMKIRTAGPSFLPEGGTENSRGWSVAEPWDYDAFVGPARRAGRTSAPHVARVVINAVFFQKRNKFGLEVAFPMMVLLASDICQSGLNLGPSNGKRTVALLPFKTVEAAGLVHPMRRFALDLPHRVGNRQR